MELVRDRHRIPSTTMVLTGGAMQNGRLLRLPASVYIVLN
jgi:hypothetical protein